MEYISQLEIDSGFILKSLILEISQLFSKNYQ